ncbi:hypothetical protein [Mycolicibacterium houstonense]|uniref:hypothetical protein n=1 Tax=Mycolicibacterium houstonense TaxID=146021 RepID=UPI0021F33A66|nr:hypothetical protein [Mycolicibacterium houstonense]
MSGFGNYLGATMGTSTNEEGRSGAVYDNAFVTNSNYPKRAALIGDDGKFIQLNSNLQDENRVSQYQPNSDLLGEVPGLISDNSTYLEVQDELTGPESLNWEDKEFVFMRAERDSLNPAKIEELASDWKSHGNTLKTESENFKETVTTAITGKWSGDSAAAAEAASTQVTKSAIYDFTPASDAIANRLTVLKDAFTRVRDDFPKDANDQLIDKGQFNKKELDDRINDFNSKYHIDGSGYLRNNDDGYVTAADALKQLDEINRSIDAYQKAVQLFQNVYTPAVVAVTKNFPNLPTPPNMKYGDPTAPGGPGGPGNPGGPGGPKTPGLGGGGGTPPLDKLNMDKNPLDKFKPDQPIDDKNKPIDQNDSTTDPTKDALDSLTDPVKSAIDSATGAAKDAIGQAMDAAKNAAQGAQNPLGSGLPPEGVLGLGPQGLGGAGAGKGGGGAGGGVPLRGLPSGLPTGAPATTAAKVTAPAAAAGLGAGAGAPGAGAPAAGQRAGDQNGKGHQVNKALRRKKNGKDVIGNPDASVPVVGADEEAAQAESAPAEQPEFRRRIPQRGNGWQPDSAVQNTPVQPARTQNFTPGRSD